MKILVVQQQRQMGNFGTNQFNISQNQHLHQLESNSIAKMSSRYDNLKKLNDSNYNKNKYKDKTNIQSYSNNTYKNIVDDWSHSIYLMNLNPKLNGQINSMNTCKEIWDKQTLFDPDKIDFDFGYCSGFTKLKIEGTHPNIDLVIPLSV